MLRHLISADTHDLVSAWWSWHCTSMSWHSWWSRSTAPMVTRNCTHVLDNHMLLIGSMMILRWCSLWKCKEMVACHDSVEIAGSLPHCRVQVTEIMRHAWRGHTSRMPGCKHLGMRQWYLSLTSWRPTQGDVSFMTNHFHAGKKPLGTPCSNNIRYLWITSIKLINLTVNTPFLSIAITTDSQDQLVCSIGKFSYVVCYWISPVV